MAERTIIKNFNNFRGKDSRSSDLVRDANYAIDFQNARVVREDSCVNREGAKIIGDSNLLTGLASYVWTDPDTNTTDSELVAISDGLRRLKESTFTVTYTGSETSALFSIRLDTDTQTFKCTISAGGVEVLSYDLGTGLEASPITLANLKTQIDALADFAASITGTTTFPAAFLPLNINTDVISFGAITFYEWEVMSTLNSTLFSAYYAARGDNAWELASFVNANNVLYIGTGYEYLHKYDGQNVYRAGLPEPPAVATLSLGGTGITDTSIKYIYLYKHIDNRGNTVMGVESDPSAAVTPANQTVSVTLRNILAADGFATGCALVNGNQTNVSTVTVTNTPHTIKAGDTIYLLHRGTGNYVEVEVESVTTTSLTIVATDGTVTVNNGDVISTNLRIAIYRSTNGGSLYYKVAEIPNNSFSSTQVYADSTLTANLGSQYVAPTKLRDVLTIKPKYLCLHQGLLIAAGSMGAPNTWYFSNSEGPEYFDAEINFEFVRDTSGGGIRGLASDQEHLIIGTETNLFVVTGDLDAGNSRQENLSKGHTGFSCHNSIVEIGGKIMFLGKTGFWAIENGYNLYEIGQPINPDFTLNGLTDAQTPRLRRACAVHVEETQEYICFVPTESGTGTARYTNENSRVFVFDTFHQAWGEWTGLNMGGGLTYHNNNIFFLSKRSDTILGITSNLWERSKTGEIDDYADHQEPIAFRLGTQWIDAGEPSVFKVYLRMKIYNVLRQILVPRFTLTVKVARDFNRDVVWFEFPLVFGEGTSAGWGYFQWGVAQWGTPRKQAKKKKLKTGKAQAIRYIMENSELHQKIAISAWETEITAPYSIEIKD